MRTLNSKKQEAKKRQRNQILIGAILVVVMFGSVFGLATMNFDNQEEGNTINYNGYKFVGQGSGWYLTIGDLDFVFQYNPYQIQESFNLTTENLKYLSSYSGMPLYINSQENTNVEGEIVRVFNGVALRIQRACLDNNGTTLENCDVNLPMKDCTSNFIIVKTSEDGENRIYQEENCVFIEGSLENLIKLTDDYLFRVMGIK